MGLRQPMALQTECSFEVISSVYPHNHQRDCDHFHYHREGNLSLSLVILHDSEPSHTFIVAIRTVFSGRMGAVHCE